jgi:hypothetical protein
MTTATDSQPRVWETYAFSNDLWEPWAEKLRTVWNSAHRLLLVRTGIRQISNYHRQCLVVASVADTVDDSVCRQGGGTVSVADVYEHSSILQSYMSKSQYLRCLAEREAMGDISVRNYDNVCGSGFFVDVRRGLTSLSSLLKDFSPKFTELRVQLLRKGQ